MPSKKYGLKHIMLIFLIIAVIFISGCASQQGSQSNSAKTPSTEKSPDSQKTAETDASKLVPPPIPE